MAAREGRHRLEEPAPRGTRITSWDVYKRMSVIGATEHRRRVFAVKTLITRMTPNGEATTYVPTAR
jgi:hypothetical protein